MQPCVGDTCDARDGGGGARGGAAALGDARPSSRRGGPTKTGQVFLAPEQLPLAGEVDAKNPFRAIRVT